MRFALAWRAVRSNQTSAFVQEEARLGQLESQMRHLNNLPKKVDAADEDAQRFYDARISPNWSTILGQLGAVATKNQVRLLRAAYAPNPAAAGGLTELHIDAGLSGQYSDLMRFINGIERDQDHVFFIIDRVTLTGQQGGLVNLRMQLRTYIRGRSDGPASGDYGDRFAGVPNAGPGTAPGTTPNAEPGPAPNGGATMRSGLDNKRNVVILSVLAVVMVGAVAYFAKSMFGGGSPAPAPATTTTTSGAHRAGIGEFEAMGAGGRPRNFRRWRSWIRRCIRS